MNKDNTYQCTVITPLGNEQFFLTLPYENDMVDLGGVGRIWNDRGQINYSGLAQHPDCFATSITTDTPIPATLRVTMSPNADNTKVCGRISIDDYGWADYDGVLNNG